MRSTKVLWLVEDDLRWKMTFYFQNSIIKFFCTNHLFCWFCKWRPIIKIQRFWAIFKQAFNFWTFWNLHGTTFLKQPLIYPQVVLKLRNDQIESISLISGHHVACFHIVSRWGIDHNREELKATHWQCEGRAVGTPHTISPLSTVGLLSLSPPRKDRSTSVLGVRGVLARVTEGVMNGGRWPLVEDDLRWKMTFGGEATSK